ncbi:MAG: hypothetical protein J5736_00235 [Bacilli bacterium]|nr:hypothetical protein [Bacilli bacterium]
MEIKRVANKLTEVDIHEWNESVKAFIRPLNMGDRIHFSDLCQAFWDDKKTQEERSEAGALIAVFTLVDEKRKALLTIEDVEAIKNAAFEPISRIINTIILNQKSEEQKDEMGGEVKSIKKKSSRPRSNKQS